MTPTIEALSLRTVSVPVDPPHRVAGGLVAASPLALLDVRCDDGVTGHAIVFAYTPLALGPLGDFLLGLRSLLVGTSAAPLAADALLRATFRLLGTEGLVGMALAGVDVALWDAEARRREVPLQRLLGAPAEGRVRAYAGVGFDGETESARQAERWAARGFRGVKAKIGYPTLAEDLAVVRAMRAAVGPDVELMVDYNQSLAPQAAIERLRALDDEGLAWVEEPVAAHEHTASARVREAIRTPLQSGENWWGPTEFGQAIAVGASDLVMPDAMNVGGVSGWRRAVALAEAASLPVSSHLWPELSARLLVCGTTTHRLEYVDWWNPILAEPLLVEAGDAVVDPDAAGSGVAWNEAAVERFRL